jgi:hypothetical protein
VSKRIKNNESMKVFIDTSEYLRYYRAFITNTYPLEKLLSLVEDGSVELILTQQVKDEFYRNKEDFAVLMKKKLNSCKKSLKVSISNEKDLKGIENELKDLKLKYTKEVQVKVEENFNIIEKNIAPNGKVDKLIERLFKKSIFYPVTRNIISAADIRKLLGNPPKTNKGSLGDAINWEILLAEMQDDLEFVCGDTDFKVENWKGEITMRDFLQREWKEKVESDIRLYPRIIDFLESLKGKVDTKRLNEARIDENLVSQYISYIPIPTDFGFSGYVEAYKGAMEDIASPIREVQESIVKFNNDPILNLVRSLNSTKINEEVRKDKSVENNR